MALSVETTAWLDELKKSGSLTDEAFNTLKSTFEANSKADDFVKGSSLRQSDYSKKMSEIQTAQRAVEDAGNALKTKEAAVTKFQGELATWKVGAEGNYSKALTEKTAAEGKAAAAVARLKALAQANGLDEAELLKDIDVTPTTETKPPFDTTQFVSKRDIADAASQASRESAMIDATIYDLGNEYQSLFGKHLPSAATLVQEALASGKTLRTYVEEKFDFSKKRGELSEAAIEERIKKEVEARTTTILSEASLQGGGRNLGGRTDITGSPVFREGGLKAPVNEGGGGIGAAVAAFNTGKFSRNQR